MKLGVLFSGGKDSTYAAYLASRTTTNNSEEINSPNLGWARLCDLAKASSHRNRIVELDGELDGGTTPKNKRVKSQTKHELTCLISIESSNTESYMFHTPNISLTKAQASQMGIPIISQKTKGKKETELRDLKNAIKLAIKKYKIQGLVTGAVESVYQSSRIQKICNELKIECFNPLWQKNQIELLKELEKNKFKIIITGVAAYPFDESWIGKELNKETIKILEKLQKELKINPSGEGGEFESLVLDCPLFKSPLKVKDIKISGEKNSFRGEVVLK
jgi:diphthine-ammonia ligase